MQLQMPLPKQRPQKLQMLQQYTILRWKLQRPLLLQLLLQQQAKPQLQQQLQQLQKQPYR